MSRRTLQQLLLALPALASTLTTAAPPAAAAPAPSRTRVVMIAPASDREATFRTLQAVRGQLSDVSARLEVHAVDQLDPSASAQLRAARAVAQLTGAAVVFWFDVRRARVSIYLHTASGGRLLQRPVRSAGAEGRFEALSVIVRFAVRGHLQGEKMGVRLPPKRPRRAARAPPARRTTPSPTPGKPPRRRFWLALEVGYDLDAYSHQVGVAHGLRVAALLNVRRRWSVFLGFRMEAPLDTASDEVSVRLHRIPLDLGARFTWRRGRLALGAQLALSVAVITARTTLLDPGNGAELAHVPTRATVALAPAAVVGVRVASRFELALTLGIRVHLDATEYREPDEPRPVLAPWRVQPTLSLALHTPLF